MSIYIPKLVYKALMANPNLTIKEIMAIQNSPYSTAARYRQNFQGLKKECDYSEQVHHKINKTKIESWRRINHQAQQMMDLLSELLNSMGFESTANLRDIYYSRYYATKSGEPQSRRNFNRYFKNARENLEKSDFRLLICRSSINRIGFYTVENPNYKPED
ncbi:hypothetical protein [Acinetobacter gerneri]|uniref:Uncharacterized protein n=1 Tax=Acinetobacter gerneri DSM 14967 = CIP 107464 = MTCC 9824 TaxID=1120926 RepID=N8ZKL6_9GAMM|nr:hypothetical protein [Acinetobacter gerneri]ENV34294.1 hypothetical protein F960_01613 [Acinetobacter gerneri DSM 14967 = CIP 107464 = MTCC 9824]